MSAKLRAPDLEQAAQKVGLSVRHESGGYRVLAGAKPVFPHDDTLPAQSKVACFGFLLGVHFGRVKLLADMRHLAHSSENQETTKKEPCNTQ